MSQGDTRPKVKVENFLTGIVGEELLETPVALPSTEPPPLATNDKLAVVGRPTPRLDGRLKVTGAARYASDVRLPGMLHARLVVSAVPHAHVRAVDTSAAEKAPGVRAVVVLESVSIVRYAGQPVAAVAAETPAAADEAARLVRVDSEPLPFVVDADAARRPKAPLVYETNAPSKGAEVKGNVRGPVESGPFGEPRGEIERGFQEAEVVVEAEYRTQVQAASALETHGLVADWTADALTVYASTEGTASMRDELAKALSIPLAKVRVVADFVGGGLGAKTGAGPEAVLAARLSKKAGAPVRLVLDRREEQVSTGSRPSSVQRLRIGSRRDGELTAIHLVTYGATGVGTGGGVGWPASNMYSFPNVLVEESDVFTNAGPSAPFRAPGHPQGCFALEQGIDELAERIGLDPLVLRDRIDQSPERRVERRAGAAKFDWTRRRAPGSDAGPVKRGIGVAQGAWYRVTNLDSAVEIRIARDGSVELLSGVQDAGGGIRTALAMVVAEELGVAAADVTVRIGDTAFPNGPASVLSATTNSITPPARNAAHVLRRRLFEAVAPELGVSPDALAARAGRVFVAADPSRSMTFDEACRHLPSEQVSQRASRTPDYAGGGDRERGPDVYGGVQFAEVAVDTETGVVRVERILAAHDCGRPINPLAVAGRIHGGVILGLSYALYEDRILDRATGLPVNADFEHYKIAGSRDVPPIEVHLIEEYRGRTSTDAGGISDPSTVPTAAAIANAVYNATGSRVRTLPMTPATVLAALAEARRGGRRR